MHEETTRFGLLGLTMRDFTERSITIHQDTNKLVPLSVVASEVLAAMSPPQQIHPLSLWDGVTAERLPCSLGEHALKVLREHG